MPSKTKAIVLCRCPRCREGKMFAHPAFHPKFSMMNKRCPVCHIQFEIEPGFFWGAMYFSYALNVAEMLGLAIATNIVFNDPGPWTYVGVLMAAILLLMPLNFRYARVLMLHWISPIKYDASYTSGYHVAK